MFTVRLGMSEHSFIGNPRIEFKWPDGRSQWLEMPKPGRTLLLPPFEVPSAKFRLDVAYWLDQTRVGVVLGAVRDKDIFTIYASPYKRPSWQGPGALYVGTMFHGDGSKEPCDVKCEGNITLEECCVLCEKDNVIVETCC
jgi:hypothetical protein